MLVRSPILAEIRGSIPKNGVFQRLVEYACFSGNLVVIKIGPLNNYYGEGLMHGELICTKSRQFMPHAYFP